MVKSVRGAADRIHSPGMFGPCNRMESTIVVSNSPKLFCLLPALPNSSGAGQGRSGVESSGEARMRAHRSNSSGRRTSPPLPASGRLEIVGPRRCSFRSSCKPKQYPRGPTPDFFLHPASRIRTPLYCLAASRLARSVPAAEGVGMQTGFSVITTNSESWWGAKSLGFGSGSLPSFLFLRCLRLVDRRSGNSDQVWWK
jgi:hypothetical protein